MTRHNSRQLPSGPIPEDYTKVRIWKQLCLQKELGMGNALFGGDMMSWIDRAAAMHLMEKCETKYMRTVGASTKFISKVNPGDIIHFYGEIIQIGKTSVTIEIDMFKTDVENGNVSPVGAAETTFVRVSDDDKKRDITLAVRKRIQKEIKERLTIQQHADTDKALHE